MSWPPYWFIAAASAAGSSLIGALLAGGNTIFWAASWVCTSLLITECPQSSSPPPIARTTARTRPAVVASASNVLLRISMPPCTRPGPAVRPKDFVVALSLTLSRAQAAGPQVIPLRDFRPGPGGDFGQAAGSRTAGLALGGPGGHSAGPPGSRTIMAWSAAT